VHCSLKPLEDIASQRAAHASYTRRHRDLGGVKGVLQPPVVEVEFNADGVATGAYLITIGEGRRLALRLLAKRKRIAKDTPVRCLLDEANDAFEISLDENITRFPMHPADQFEAFRDLAEQQGRSAEEIAKRFGVSAQTVRQRLRLGAVSPALIAAYRADDLTLEQLMAFALCEDHARQDQVFAALAYNRSPSAIRRMLTEQEVEASDARAILIGAEAYVAAGGHIRRDLFADDDGGWFEDVALLDRLALEALAIEAEAVRSAEGWAWAEAYLDYPYDHGFGRVYPIPHVHDDAIQMRLHDLSAEYDMLIQTYGEADGFPAEVDERLKAIDIEQEAASTPRYAPDAYASAGVFVVLQHDGAVRVERGLLRAEDIQAPVVRAVQDAANPPVTPTSPAGAPMLKALSEGLVADLTAHRTAALRDQLAAQPEVALLAVLHAMVLQVFQLGAGETCFELHLHRTSLSSYAQAYEGSFAEQAIAARHGGWTERLAHVGDLWAFLSELDGDEQSALFAHCASMSINAVKLVGRSRRSLADADRLAEHLALDMTAYWQATPDSYFGRVSKAQILADVREAKSVHAARQLEGLKKDAMAKTAADLLGSEGWLPPLMKGAAVPPA
jgi:ParB family chromosome partitioning protein